MNRGVRILKLVPAAVLKPWGLVSSDALGFTGIRVGIGELWLASAQTGPGNCASPIAEPNLGKTLAELLDEAAAQGDDTLAEWLGAEAVRVLRDNPHRGKTEAWYIRATEGRTGLASGPRTQQQLAELKRMVKCRQIGPDIAHWPQPVRDLMGLVEPLKAGQVFLVPCGTMHTIFAIGRDSRLIIDELQQGYGESKLPTLSKILMVQDNLLSIQVHPCDSTVSAAAARHIEIEQDLATNPTVRISDFGRRPGERPDLGFSLVNLEAGVRRVPTVTVEPSDGVSLEVLVADSHLARSRVRMQGGRIFALSPTYRCYHVLHCRSGAVRLNAGRASLLLSPGETAFVPGALEESLALEAVEDCELFDDSLPQLPALRNFLTSAGAEAARVEELFSPPTVL